MSRDGAAVVESLPLFAADIRRQRVSRMRGFRHWRWHLHEAYVRINGEMCYLWRAVDHEGEVLESYVTKSRDKAAALRFMRKTLKRHGSPEAIVTDGLRSYKAAMNELGNAEKQEIGHWANNRVENSHLPFRRAFAAMWQKSPALGELTHRPPRPVCGNVAKPGTGASGFSVGETRWPILFADRS